MTYHLGLVQGHGNGLWRNGHRDTTLVLQARRSIDYLSCDLWKYLGPHVITKAQLRRNAANGEMLAWINHQYKSAFTHLVID